MPWIIAILPPFITSITILVSILELLFHGASGNVRDIVEKSPCELAYDHCQGKSDDYWVSKYPTRRIHNEQRNKEANVLIKAAYYEDIKEVKKLVNTHL